VLGIFIRVSQNAPHVEPLFTTNVLSNKSINSKLVLEYLLRFIAGGVAVSAFATLGDTLRPKSFAGLFGAAPSIALATILITLSQKVAPFVALEGRSMIVGAVALAAYSWTVCVLLQKFMMSSRTIIELQKARDNSECDGEPHDQCEHRGVKRTIELNPPMSAIGGKADIALLGPNVCF
jgi:hypothetical protein